MSDAAAVPAQPQRPLTTEASNVLGFWWLAIVTTIVLLCAMWPSIFTDSASGFGSYLLWIISAVLIAVGIWCTIGFMNAEPWSARVMRLTTMIGLGVGLAGVAYFLYAVAFASTPNNTPGFFGPSGVLSGVLWALIILLPFIFGLTFIFGLMNDAIDDWFSPPAIFIQTRTGMRVDPATAALLAGGAGAVSAGLTDEALMGELNEAMSLTDKSQILDEDHSVEVIGGDESESIEVIGSAEDDLSVEVIGGEASDESSDSMADLAALEEALTEDASKKLPKPAKKEQKPTSGDEPLAVDDDFKL